MGEGVRDPAVEGLFDALAMGRSHDAETTTLWYAVDIAANREAVWAAITSSDFVREFYYGLSLDADWEPGGILRYVESDGTACMLGVIEAIEPGRSFSATIRYVADPVAELDPPSHVSWRIEETPGGSRLRIEHRGLASAGQTLAILEGGWPLAVVGLKALVETGSAVAVQAEWPTHRRARLEG